MASSRSQSDDIQFFVREEFFFSCVAIEAVFSSKQSNKKKMQRPSPRLYKHALESIFAHLDLPELARICATCRDWSAAVNSMRTIGAPIKMKQTLDLHSMNTSRLMRHVVAIHLTGRSISASDLSSLCDIIQQSKSLTLVYLSGNQLGVVGASAIAEGHQTASRWPR